jgi:zinc transport system substrate-binding protein
MNKKYIIGLLILVILIVGSFVVLSNKKENTSLNNKIKIVTTLFPLYDFAKEIGGDKVEVSLLLPPGIEAHNFEPKPSDIVEINESDIFVYTGEFMEPWAHDIIESLTNKNIKVVDSSSGIDLLKEEHEHENHEEGIEHDHDNNGHSHEHENNHGGVDPHIWLGLDNTQTMVDNITKALIEKDSTNASYYQNNSVQYKNKLSHLDNQYKSGLEKCESKEIIYGGHYAFGYMAKRYGLTYTSAQGFSPDGEPTAKDLVSLVDQIKKNNIKYVFYEELASPKIAETLANETKTKMLLLNGAHNITKEDYKNNVSFISIMENNLTNLKTGLVCK